MAIVRSRYVDRMIQLRTTVQKLFENSSIDRAKVDFACSLAHHAGLLLRCSSSSIGDIGVSEYSSLSTLLSPFGGSGIIWCSSPSPARLGSSSISGEEERTAAEAAEEEEEEEWRAGEEKIVDPPRPLPLLLLPPPSSAMRALSNAAALSSPSAMATMFCCWITEEAAGEICWRFRRGGAALSLALVLVAAPVLFSPFPACLPLVLACSKLFRCAWYFPFSDTESEDLTGPEAEETQEEGELVRAEGRLAVMTETDAAVALDDAVACRVWLRSGRCVDAVPAGGDALAAVLFALLCVAAGLFEEARCCGEGDGAGTRIIGMG
jgi:hypothetical protein